jgi:hypothetical protein
MRARTFVHVAGPVGGGKTTFIERLLDARIALAICVRTERDAALQREQASAPKSHAELGRYRKAGASRVALYRFPTPDMDVFFTSGFMENYSEAVFLEGESPVEYVDLSVFVAPPLPDGRTLLRRVVRDHAVAHQAAIERFEQLLESPEAMAHIMDAALGGSIASIAREQPQILDDLRRSMSVQLRDARRAPPPAPTEHWALEAGYEGIERAQLLVVNVRSDAERPSAQALIDDVARIRSDKAVYRDVVGPRGRKLAITAVVTDLSNPKDTGLKKAIARVKRPLKRASL